MCFFFPLALFLSLSQPCCWCMCACVCASVWKRTKYKTKLQWHSSNQLYYVHHPVVALGREQPKNGTPKNQNFGSSKKKKTQIYSAHLGTFHHVHHLSSRGFSRWHIHITFHLTDFLSLHRTPFFFSLHTRLTCFWFGRSLLLSLSHTTTTKRSFSSLSHSLFFCLCWWRSLYSYFRLRQLPFPGFLKCLNRCDDVIWHDFFPPYHGVFTLWSLLLFLLFWLIT